MPAVRTDLALTYAEIGLVLAVPQLASAVVEPVIGVLGDVWRRQTLVVAGGIAYALGLLLVAVSDGVLGLAAAFALLYPASGAFVSLSQATLMDLEPGGREHAMLRWTIWGYVGALAGPPVAAAVLFAGIGWRPLFVFFAVAAVGLALAARAVPAGGGNGTVGDGFRAAVRALRRGAVLRWLVLLEAGDLLLDVFMSFLALYLVDEAGLEPGAAALAVTAWIAAGLVGNFLVLRLLRRVSGLRYLRTSAVAAAALFAAFMLVPGTATKLAAVALLGIVTAGWYPLLKARLYGELPERSGTAMALASVTGVFAAVPPLVIGVLAAQVGLVAALWVLLLAPCMLLVLVPRR